MHKILVVVVAGLSLGVHNASAKKSTVNWRAWQQNTTKVTEGSLTYYVHTPPRYSETSGKRYPLLVLLHWSYVKGSAYLHYWRPDADQADIITAAPNSRGGAAWVRADGPNIVNMVKQITEKYPIDKDRIWLAGYSAGAVYAYRMLFDFPETFNTVLALGGRIGKRHSSASPKAPSATPRVCIFHGAWDRRFGQDSDKRDVALLRRLGYSVEHVVVPRLGHWIPRNQGQAMIQCLAGGPWSHRLSHRREGMIRRSRHAITQRIEYPLPASAARLSPPNRTLQRR
jgi:predicted esterase